MYIAIDLKSFYASVECVERGLDPLTTHLVVADVERTQKTICLAVSPSLKSYGIPGRARLFEVEEKVRLVNAARRLAAPGHRLVGTSCNIGELNADARLAVSYIAAKPRMRHYMNASAKVYGVYLRYAAAEDIHVYSIDEVFIDATRYLRALGMTPRQMATAIVRDIRETTGLTATAGIGTNLYLAKVAMDIVAKHEEADEYGVRVAELNERTYRERLWAHRPLTDFWRVGRGYANKLERQGLLTMGDIARCSVGRSHDYYNEDLLYRMFGVNAELLIDHAWGWEPCTIADIKHYTPDGHSISSGQVLTGPALSSTARLIAKEMADALALDLMEKGVLANRVALVIGYDTGSIEPDRLEECASEDLKAQARQAAQSYRGPVSVDYYGRKVPKPAAGSIGLGGYTVSDTRIREAVATLFDRIADPRLLVRRLTVVADDLHTAQELEAGAAGYEQLDLFAEQGEGEVGAGLGRSAGAGVGVAGTESAGHGTVGSSGSEMSIGAGSGAGAWSRSGIAASQPRGGNAVDEHQSQMIQQTLLAVKQKFGRNAVIKAMDMEEGATGQDRNHQIGGHAA
ncbi:type VI secretion protein ImpB [Bifidobacterium oedipodis]|uniref:Y-family DNA polymerase n=1 Tax=Bifidobacterium oedipodis TaxID=2675322 RepID=UPI002FF7C6F2